MTITKINEDTPATFHRHNALSKNGALTEILLFATPSKWRRSRNAIKFGRIFRPSSKAVG
jgi:hypothetical protein